jgi:hypothetical protein
MGDTFDKVKEGFKKPQAKLKKKESLTQLLKNL